MTSKHCYSDKYAKPQGVYGRRMVFCPRLQEFSTEELIVTCKKCYDFAIFCCCCDPDARERYGSSCHKFRLILTDGACSYNGTRWATSGIGIALGTRKADQVSVPITADMDGDHRRTSQRAELLAALKGLRFMMDNEGEPEEGKISKPCYKSSPDPCWVIATDSEYVVKGMTEWLPRWKKNNLRTNRGTVPANLDLFLEIDEEIEYVEASFTDLSIGFWHIGREYNEIADRLAKEASLDGDLAS